MARVISLAILLGSSLGPSLGLGGCTPAPPPAPGPGAEVAAAKAEAPGSAPVCPHGGIHPEGCDGPVVAADTSQTHFGAQFAEPATVPLRQALAGLTEDPVRVSGTVESVCQKKGCWMVLTDGDQGARILMKDHAFAVPMDCKGKRAEVEGVLTARTFTEAQAKHLEQDRGGDPNAVSGARKEYVLSATGVRLLES